MDDYLEKMITRYDDWIAQKKITHSSRVIPVNESLTPENVVLPTQQAQDILKQARVITLANCDCRQRYHHCDKPLEVCFILNDVGEKRAAQGRSRVISLDTALETLALINDAGLVHMSLYQPNHEVFAFCSCCECCCHDLQLVFKYGRHYLTQKSGYIARHDASDCTQCGICIDRCPFDARRLEARPDSDVLIYDPDRCYGCGLCVSTCPEQIIEMVKEGPGSSV